MVGKKPYRIAEFARFREPIELRWLGSIVKEGGDWMVQAAIQPLERDERHNLVLPFGLMPALVPGRIYVDGMPATSVGHGTPGTAVIPDTRVCEVVCLSDLPASLFPNGQARKSQQPILHYRIGDRDLFVPPLELIRRLFLFEKALAHAILRPGGLWQLVRFEETGFFDERTLHFTEAMPLKALTPAFIRKFGWIVFSSTGQRAWRSVAQMLTPEGWPMLDPPKVRNSRWTYRALTGDNAELVLEILGLKLGPEPCKVLNFEHPLDTSPSRTRVTDDMSQPSAGEHDDKTGAVEKHFVVQDEGSRRDVRQDAIDLDSMLSDFDGPAPKIRRRRQDAGMARDTSAQHGTPRGDDEDGQDIAEDAPRRHQTIRVSVSDISTTGTLQPISFRLLEPAPPGYEGDLRPLIDTLRRMREMLPSVKIAGTPCVLPGDKPVTRVGLHRRPCMVATFQHPSLPLTVLIDIDHSQDLALSALKLASSGGFAEMEYALKHILSEMTDRNGRWPPNLEQDFSGSVEIKRIPRLLRKDIRMDDDDYQTKWAAMLVEKLGLEHLMAL